MTIDFDYNPDNLLDSIKAQLNLKNDAALSRALHVAPPIISKIRKRRSAIGSSFLVRLHEISALPIKDLRALMGDTRPNFEPIEL